MGDKISGAVSPTALTSPRNTATDTFAQMLVNALQSGGNVGDLLSQITRTTPYSGQLTAPTNSGQNVALQAANTAFARLFGMTDASAGKAGSNFSNSAPQVTQPVVPGAGNIPLPSTPTTPGTTPIAPPVVPKIPSGIPGGIPGFPGGLLMADPNASTMAPQVPQAPTAPGSAVSALPNLNMNALLQLMQGMNSESAPGPTAVIGPSIEDPTDGTDGFQPNFPSGGNPGGGNPGGVDTSGNWPIPSTPAVPTNPAIPNVPGQPAVPNVPGQPTPTTPPWFNPTPTAPGTVPGTLPVPPITTGTPGGTGTNLPVPPITSTASIGPTPGASATDPLQKIASSTGLTIPPQLLSLLQGTMAQGGNLSNLIQSSVNQPNQYVGQLAQVGQQDNPVSQLLTMVGMGPGASSSGSDYLKQLATNPQVQNLLAGGKTTDLNTIAQAISAASQPGLDRNVRDLREQFSTLGLRDSSNINEGVSNLMSQNQANITSQLAQLMPTLNASANNTSSQTLSSLTDLGKSLGTLGQGDLSSKIAALTGAGNLNLGQSNVQANALTGAANTATATQSTALDTLSKLLATTSATGTQQAGILSNIFNNQQNNATSAATALPGATATVDQLPGQLASQNLALNSVAQGTDQANLTNQYNAWLQSQGLTPQLLSFLGTTPATQYGSSPVNSAANAALAASAITTAIKQGNNK